MAERKSSFAPIANERTRVLVLGSLPGAKSLEARQYYANRTNQFWRLIGDVIVRDLTALGYEARLEALLEAGIGLWDVVADAARVGSLDADIREIRENQFVDLAQSLPQIRALGFNGGKAAKIGIKRLGRVSGLEPIALPSSSAAYCAIPYAAKRERWFALRPYLAQ
ncbi:MAG: DNA-deoxyinosine glycosylase [Novosphingobium sp.]